MTEMKEVIGVRDLRYVYPDGKEALKGISFTVHEGERVAVIGPNGSGKSTLLLHLNGILPENPPAEPRVMITGLPATSANLPAIRRTVGLLFQDPDDQLFCPTVYEDVAFGPQQFGLAGQRLDAAVRSALERAGLEGSPERSPHHLSGGEKRRVCLAGVLACNPALLVLDEPTSGLDPRGKRELATLLAGLGSTTVIATHDLELVVRLCPRTIVLDAGAIVADGPTRQLLSDEPLMVRHGLEKPHILLHHHPHGADTNGDRTGR
jgi:energy-coupling factor transporter ATP-binding protein EcfA2